MDSEFMQVTGWGEERVADAVPVLPALRKVLPTGLMSGSVVTVRDISVGLALAAGASSREGWCGVVGIPELGVAAAVGAGVDPARLMLVPEPGRRWADAVVSLLAGCAVVLARPPGRVTSTVRRAVVAAARRDGGVVLVAGSWEGAWLRLRVTRRRWVGIGDGHGRVRACRAEVVVDGRGATGGPRSCWLWLPAPDGTVRACPESDTAGWTRCTGVGDEWAVGAW